MNSTVGILGGMGPLATVDFVQKIIRGTTASRDQEHLPLLVHSVPQIPDRTACLMDGRESPLPALTRAVKVLAGAGVGCIAMPCNTAHYWHEELSRISPVPILHIATACAEQLASQGIKRVGLMATDGTLKADIYPRELNTHGIELSPPSPELQRQIMQGIYRVKAGAVTEGAQLLERSLNEILATGVERVILGCTEIPVALDRLGVRRSASGIDATDALATACINWYRGLASTGAAA